MLNAYECLRLTEFAITGHDRVISLETSEQGNRKDMRDTFHFGRDVIGFFIDGQLIESSFNWTGITQTIDLQRLSLLFLIDG